MRIVTVAAANAFGVHPALQEGTVLVHLPLDLPIGMIEAGLEQRGQMLIHQAGAIPILAPERGSSRMTTSAGFDLHSRVARTQIELEAQVSGFSCGRSRWILPGPFDVTRSGAMTGLAADVDACIARLVGLGGRIVVLVQIGGMALRAHIVPILRWLGPVQLIVGIDAL